MKKVFLYGNWKMNMLPVEALAFCNDLLTRTKGGLYNAASIEIALFPAYISIAPVVQALPDDGIIRGGAQDGWFEDRGAYTGAVSMDMLRSVGCTHVLVGHSERRSIFGDTDALVGRKLRKALNAGLVPVLCYGETLEEREAGLTTKVIERQLKSAWEGLDVAEIAGGRLTPAILLAYEPIWAIGTGRNARPEDAQEVCALSRNLFKERFGPDADCPILYGGSVKESNSAELLSRPDIDGALVGGASLKVESFLGIYENYRRAQAEGGVM